MVNAVFKKFGELQNRVEKEVEGLIEFDEVDYEAEIARLEDRLRELKDAKNKSDLSTKDPRSDIRKKVAASNKTFATPNSVASETEQYDTGTEYETVSVPSDLDREIEDDESDEGSEEASLIYATDDEDAVSPEQPDAPIRPQEAGRSSLFDRVRGQVAPPAKTHSFASSTPATQAPPTPVAPAAPVQEVTSDTSLMTCRLR